jgi:predicted O-methyltransferase YrrM
MMTKNRIYQGTYQEIMKSTIAKVIAELEKRSQLEKSGKISVERQDRMLAITPDTGEFYYALLTAQNAKNVLELGTSTGYSTLFIVGALLENHKNPKITTIEQNPSKISRAKRNFRRARVSRHIKVIHSKIIDVLKKVPKRERFDFVLIDADKENVKKYFDLILPHLMIGGIIATDNMYYPKKYRRIMANYSKHIVKKPNVWTTTLPIGNGQEITIKMK